MSSRTYDRRELAKTVIEKYKIPENISPFAIEPYTHPGTSAFRLSLAGDRIQTIRLTIEELKQLNYDQVCQEIMHNKDVHDFDADNNKALEYLLECLSWPTPPDRDKLEKLAMMEVLK